MYLFFFKVSSDKLKLYLNRPYPVEKYTKMKRLSWNWINEQNNQTNKVIVILKQNVISVVSM